jgi:uncharacterized membrane protein
MWTQHMENGAAYAIRCHETYQITILTTLMRLQGARLVFVVELLG